MPKAITSLEGYIRKLGKLVAENPRMQLAYRGHSKSEYKIAPSVFRNENLKSSEHLMIRQLIAQHPSEFSSDKWVFDQLVRGQHYGLPTRLLDVSINPLVALYFAVCSNPSSKAAVIVFKPAVGGQKYFDGDVVSCICALSLLTGGEKEELKSLVRETVVKVDRATLKLGGADLAEFNSHPVLAKLLQLVRQEKPDFRAIIQPIDLVKPVFVTPKKLHQRILAQNGAFVLFGLAEKPTSSNMRHIETETIHIAAASKAQIEKELSSVGITESSMFPEIERAAVAIKGRYS